MAFSYTAETGEGVSGALWTGSAGVGTDFSLSASPSSQTIEAGEATTFAITVDAPDGLSSAVVFSVSGLPAGTFGSFSPSSLSGSGTTTLTILTDDSAPADVATLVVTGIAGMVTHTVDVTLTITAPPPLGTIQFLIDGLDRTGYIHYPSGSFHTDLLRGQRGSCTIPLIIGPGDTFAPQIGQLLEVFDQGVRQWIGTVDSLEITWFGDDGWHVTTVTGVSLESLFDGVQLDEQQYVNQTAGAIVTALFTAADLPIVTLGTISDGPNVISINVTNVADALNNLSLLAGFIWYIDPRDGKLYFHNPADRAADWTVVDGNILWETADWKQTRQDFADASVFQVPGFGNSTNTTSFPGDGTTTVFTLPEIPQFVESSTVQPVGTGADTPIPFITTWTPGTDKISVTSANGDPMTNTETLVVTWIGSPQVVVQNTNYGAVAGGSRSRRYVLTRAFTKAGVIQQATAALARYAYLPAELIFQTDKPGITIGRALTIDITFPLESGAFLNGVWQVQEVEAAIVDGLDQREEPFGHFRYTLHLINFLATAVFSGDGSSSTFLLPEIPTSAPTITVSNAPGTFATNWVMGSNQIVVTPAPPPGATVTVGYPGAQAPDVQPAIGTFGNMAAVTDPPTAANQTDEVPSTTPAPQQFIRTLTLRDLTVRDDAGPDTLAYHAGIGVRIMWELRLSLTHDLTVRFNMNAEELITITVPMDSATGEEFEIPLVIGSPPIAVLIPDKAVFTYDILESDGQQDLGGVIQFTLQWEYS